MVMPEYKTQMKEFNTWEEQLQHNKTDTPPVANEKGIKEKMQAKKTKLDFVLEDLQADVQERHNDAAEKRPDYSYKGWLKWQKHSKNDDYCAWVTSQNKVIEAVAKATGSTNSITQNSTNLLQRETLMRLNKLQ